MYYLYQYFHSSLFWLFLIKNTSTSLLFCTCTLTLFYLLKIFSLFRPFCGNCYCFNKFFVTNLEWLTVRYIFFSGACFSNTTLTMKGSRVNWCSLRFRNFREVSFKTCLCQNYFFIGDYVRKLLTWIWFHHNINHCVKRCPYSEFFWSVFSDISTAYGSEKLWIRSLFMQRNMVTINLWKSNKPVYAIVFSENCLVSVSETGLCTMDLHDFCCILTVDKTL